jgi:transposase
MRMDYPTAVLEKAKRLEQLLQRVAAGEPLDEVNEALGLNLDEKQLVRAQAKYEAGGCRWEALIDGRYGHAQKVHSGIREWLYTRKERDEEVRAPQLAKEIKEKFGVEVEPGHVNYLLRKRGLTAPPGHPYKKEPGGEERRDATAPDECIDNAGLFFPGGSEGGHGGGGSD